MVKSHNPSERHPKSPAQRNSWMELTGQSLSPGFQRLLCQDHHSLSLKFNSLSLMITTRILLLPMSRSPIFIVRNRQWWMLILLLAVHLLLHSLNFIIQHRQWWMLVLPLAVHLPLCSLNFIIQHRQWWMLVLPLAIHLPLRSLNFIIQHRQWWMLVLLLAVHLPLRSLNFIIQHRRWCMLVLPLAVHLPLHSLNFIIQHRRWCMQVYSSIISHSWLSVASPNPPMLLMPAQSPFTPPPQIAGSSAYRPYSPSFYTPTSFYKGADASHTNVSQPFYLMFVKGNIFRCAGCGLKNLRQIDGRPLKISVCNTKSMCCLKTPRLESISSPTTSEMCIIIHGVPLSPQITLASIQAISKSLLMYS